MVEKFRCLNCYGDRCHEIGNLKICDYCGSKFSEKRYEFSASEASNLNLAILDRKRGDFDESSSRLETLIDENDNVAEYYYQNLLAKLGVNFVDDNGDKKITVSRLSDKNVFELKDAKKALELAQDEETREQYKEDFSIIESIRDRYIKIANKCEKYDVFICFKEKSTLDKHARTEDSKVAREVYDFLKSKNISVFYSPISLNKVIGEDYEPIIYHALYSAKIMFVVSATPDKDYLNSPWVKNEWSRFVSLMTRDNSSNKIIIPILANGVTVDSLPSKLSCKQALMYDGHFYDVLENSVLKKVLHYNSDRYANDNKKNDDICVSETRYANFETDKEVNNKVKGYLKFIIPIFALLLIIIMIFAISYYNRTTVSFDSSDAIGQNYLNIVSKLEKQGFSNITYNEDNYGWEKSGTVIDISIDGNNSFGENDEFLKKSNIIITLSSSDRKYVTDILSSWNGKNYLDIKKDLTNAGFSNIAVESYEKNDTAYDNKTFEIILNDKVYTDGECYLPYSAPIIIKCWVNNIVPVLFDSSDAIGQNYWNIVSKLTKQGFSNITYKEVTYGWEKSGNIIDISIDGKNSFGENDEFHRKSKIIITFSSSNRKYVTDILSSWNGKNYLDIKKDLTNAGFSNIAVESYEKNDTAYDNKTFEIILNDKVYTDGECYLPYSAPIIIKCWVYVIEIGIDSSSLNKIDKEGYEYRYLALVDYLRKQGFTNITLLREEYTWFGSQLFNEQGNIYEMSINGNTAFSSTDYFEYDCKIIIKVKTDKGKDYPSLPSGK